MSRGGGRGRASGARTALTWFLALACGLSFLVCLLLVNVELVSYDLSVYRASFIATGAPDRTGLTFDQLVWVTRRVLDYSTGRRADLQFDRADLDGGPPGRPAFTQREVDHMVDVRELFARAARWRGGAAGAAAITALTLFLLERRRSGAYLARGFIIAAALSMLLWAVLALSMRVSFTSVWDAFHLRLFDNDLWQLPRGSLLIEMLPESLFHRLALGVAGSFTAGALLILLLSGFYLRRFRRLTRSTAL